MLDFETCKRLKEAGFPQVFHEGSFPYCIKDNAKVHGWVKWTAGHCGLFDGTGEYGADNDPEYFIVQPRIEDLLRELEKDNPWEINLNGEWQNMFPGGEYIWAATVGEKEVFGTSPESALSNLYLALHDGR